MIVNQWVPAAHRGDAIGDSARVVRGMLRRRGHQLGSLRAHRWTTTCETTCGRSRTRPHGRGDVTIFHFALPSPMTAAFAALPGLRVLQYHNITPAAFFAPYDPQLFRLAALGRQELRTLAGSRGSGARRLRVQPRGSSKRSASQPTGRAADCGRHGADHRARRGARRSTGSSATA